MTLHLKRFSLILLMALLPLLPLIAGKTFAWQGLLVVLVAAVAALAWSIGAVLDKSERRWAPDAVDVALGLFIALQLLSWFPSVYRFATALYGAKVLAYAAVFWFFRYGLRDRRWWRAGLWCLMLGGLLLAVIGLQEYVRTVRFLNQPDWRVFGPMFNPNIAAGYLLLTIFPAAALLFGAQSRAEARPAPVPAPAQSKSRRASQKSKPSAPPAAEPQLAPRYTEIAALFSALLMFVTILLTGSKGALGALLVAVVVFGLLAFRGGGRARLVRLGILAFVGVTIALAFTLPPLRERLLSAFAWQSHSTIFRAYTWQSTLLMIKAKPLLGFGGGTFENILPRYAIAGFTRAAHQSFLQIAAECGLPALLAGLAWATLLLRGLLLNSRRSAQPLQRFVAVAAIAALIASAIQQLADYAWYVPAVGIAFFALAGLGLTAGAPAPDDRARPLPRPALWVLLILSLSLFIWSGKALYAEHLATRAEAEIAAGNYPTAVDTLDLAAAWNPAQAQFPVQTAKLEEAMGSRGDREPLVRAVEARQRAIKLQPTEPINYLALSRLYERAGDLPSALRAVRQAIQWYPTYPRGLAQLGLLQERLGQHGEALETYRRLIAVYHSPTGKYPPVQDLIETAYAQGWIAWGDEMRRQGHETEALDWYRQAADLLGQAIGSERRMSQQMAGSGESEWGHLQENMETATDLLARLQKSDNPVAVRLMIGLHNAMGDDNEAQRLLRYLSDLRPSSRTGRLVQAWATLQLAENLSKDKQEEARTLAKKGLVQATAALSSNSVQANGWQATDSDELNRLKSWADTFTR